MAKRLITYFQGLLGVLAIFLLVLVLIEVQKNGEMFLLQSIFYMIKLTAALVFAFGLGVSMEMSKKYFK